MSATLASRSEVASKELAAALRGVVARMLEEGSASEDVSAIDDAARRLEFGHLPPAEPLPKSPIELKRDEEIHAGKVAEIERWQKGGLGIKGRAVFVQESGYLHLFAKLDDCRTFCEAQKGVNWDLYGVVFHSPLGQEITIMEMER